MNEQITRSIKQKRLIVFGLQIYASEDYTCSEQQQKRQGYKMEIIHIYLLVILNNNVTDPRLPPKQLKSVMKHFIDRNN